MSVLLRGKETYQMTHLLWVTLIPMSFIIKKRSKNKITLKTWQQISTFIIACKICYGQKPSGAFSWNVAVVQDWPCWWCGWCWFSAEGCCRWPQSYSSPPMLRQETHHETDTALPSPSNRPSLFFPIAPLSSLPDYTRACRCWFFSVSLYTAILQSTNSERHIGLTDAIMEQYRSIWKLI